MSYSRSQYYEVRREVVSKVIRQSSRSRSRDRKYRREYREEGYRYGGSSYGGGGGGSEYADRRGGGSYRRSSRPQQHGHELPPPSSHSDGECKTVLAVFNLSIYTTEAELYDVFTKFGPLQKATVVLDAKTGRSRGFGFVYFDSVEDAKVAHAQANGIEIGDRRIRVDYSATEKPHDPTPGVYYGKVSYPKGGPPLGPPAAPVAGNMGGGGGASGAGGYYHCRACEIEARERERWEREQRRYGNGEQYYYQDRYAALPEPPRSRDRSAVSRSRSDYYRGGANIR